MVDELDKGIVLFTQLLLQNLVVLIPDLIRSLLEKKGQNERETLFK